MFFPGFSEGVLVDEYTSRPEPGGGAPGNHPHGLRSGIRCDRLPRWKTPSTVQGEVKFTSKRRGRLRPEIHDLAGCFRPDVKGIHWYMRDSEVYHETVATLSSTLTPSLLAASPV